ncbi:hypothetical protein AB0F17_50610 [Nonomuraea sp. NPDC026600]|uniref:hypothetical protein n=1 Tax=Nonomuraea sp. NPDC026600 TaxID=3155363 RepID=UPI0033F52AD3
MNQFIDSGQLRWDAEVACESCGTGWCEQFGSGETPEDIRSPRRTDVILLASSSSVCRSVWTALEG